MPAPGEHKTVQARILAYVPPNARPTIWVSVEKSHEIHWLMPTRFETGESMQTLPMF